MERGNNADFRVLFKILPSNMELLYTLYIIHRLS